MSTAQVLYEQYKVLPKNIQKELKTLIESDETSNMPIMEQIERGLHEVKLIREGKKKPLTLANIFDE